MTAGAIHRQRLARRFRARPARRRANAPVRFQVAGRQTWFGYYDLSPFDRESRRILAMVVNRLARTPRADDVVDIGWFDVADPARFHPLSSTTTWCWQQGCRLRWWSTGTSEPEAVLYNRLVGGNYGSSVIDLQSGSVVRDMDIPLYDVDPHGRYGVSLNFSRLQRLRPGYGYVNIPDATAGIAAPPDDGIWSFDFESGEKQLMLSLDTLSGTSPQASMHDAEHYVNHLSYSPNGKRILFFHLWTRGGKRYCRMMIIGPDGKDLRAIYDGAGLVSHFAWKSDDVVLATVNVQGRSTYRVFDLVSFATGTLGEEALVVDGHPSYAADGTTILTDTYPDRFGEQKLLLYSPDSGIRELGRFYAPVRFRGEWRCDLHPRWDRSRRLIAFDSTHDGWRSLYVLDPLVQE